MSVRIICLFGVALVAEVYGKIVGDCPGISLPCTIHRFLGDECSTPALRAAFPGVYETNSSSFPGMPGSLDISARYKYWPDRNVYKPEANLTFTTPQSGAINYVKGFEIIRTAPVVKPACYILDLSSVIWNGTLEELSTVFRLELFPLQYRFYSFTLYALPKQETKDELYDQYRRKYMELPEYTDDSTASGWKASIFIVQNNKEGSVTVSIDPPPEEFGFKQFEYTLLDAIADKSIETKTLEKLSVVFDDLYDNETYKVWVKPHDPNFKMMNVDLCLCLDNDGLICAHCLTTTTRDFTYVYTGPPRPTTRSSTTPTAIKVPEPTPEKETTTKSETKITTKSEQSVTMEPEEETDVKVALAVVGVLVGLGLILGVAGFMFYRKCRASYSCDNPFKPKPPGGDGVPQDNPGYNGSPSNKGPNNIHAEKLKFEKRPKLVLLYEEDHEYHRQVVQHFASFLQQHCQCAAMCVEWQLDAPWVHEDIAQADFVVIVNSEGAYQSYMSQYGHKVNANGLFKGPQISKQMSNINSIRNKFLHDERYDNVVMVYFEYTDEQFVLPDICPGYKYKLLKHFTDFLLHIHKLRRTHNLALYDLPFDGSFSKKPIGQLLLESMHKAVQFQNDNPNWAKKRLAYNRMVSHTSEESQFDSGLPDDWLRIPSVDHALPSFDSPDQKEMLRILDGNSICTVNPSDIGVTIPADYNALPTVSENVPSLSVSKLRPKLSPHSFDGNPNVPLYQKTPSPPTCSTVESDFGFFPPDDFDDNYDAVSKSISEQMKSIVDRYQASNHSKPHNPERPVTTHYEIQNEGHVNGALEQENVNPYESYDRSNDLYLLKVQSGEIPFISCNIDSDAVSLGGESV